MSVLRKTDLAGVAPAAGCRAYIVIHSKWPTVLRLRSATPR